MKSRNYIIAATVGLLALGSVAYAETSFITHTEPNQYQYFNFFSATSTTATSTNVTGGGGYLKIAGAKKVTFYFQRGDTNGQGNTGTTTFKIQVSPDGSNWYDYNKLQPNLSTSTTPTSAGSVVASASIPYLNATSTQIYSMEFARDAFFGVRCIAVELADGQHTCKGAVEY